MGKRSDVSKAMYIETKEIFTDNLKAYSKAEWKAFLVMKESNKSQETYDTVGNLKPASEKLEGAPIDYGKIVDGHTTTVINKTYVNGFTVSMEEKEDEKWGLVNKTKTGELARTMMSLRENESANVWNGVINRIGADGVAFASTSHPLINTTAFTNSNLLKGAFGFDNYDLATRSFNDWKNQYGEKFITKPSNIYLNIKNQTDAIALISSNLKPFEESNTKNTIPQLTLTFGSYLAEKLYHFVDKTIDSAIMQKRKGLVTEYDYDKRSTFNFYFNVHERYKTAMINAGYGFLTLDSE